MVYWSVLSFFKAHSGCFCHLPKQCNFGYMHRLILPPYAVSVPNIQLWSSCSRSRVGSASLKRGKQNPISFLINSMTVSVTFLSRDCLAGSDCGHHAVGLPYRSSLNLSLPSPCFRTLLSSIQRQIAKSKEVHQVKNNARNDFSTLPTTPQHPTCGRCILVHVSEWTYTCYKWT